MADGGSAAGENDGGAKSLAKTPHASSSRSITEAGGTVIAASFQRRQLRTGPLGRDDEVRACEDSDRRRQGGSAMTPSEGTGSPCPQVDGSQRIASGGTERAQRVAESLAMGESSGGIDAAQIQVNVGTDEGVTVGAGIHRRERPDGRDSPVVTPIAGVRAVAGEAVTRL